MYNRYIRNDNGTYTRIPQQEQQRPFQSTRPPPPPPEPEKKQPPPNQGSYKGDFKSSQSTHRSNKGDSVTGKYHLKYKFIIFWTF